MCVKCSVHVHQYDIVLGLNSATVISLPTDDLEPPPHTHTHSFLWPPFDSVVGWLIDRGMVASVSLWLRACGEGRLLVHVGHTAGIGCVSGGGVGSRVIGGGGVGWRVGVMIRWRLCVGWDGNFMSTTSETAQGKIGQDPLCDSIKMTKTKS